jgi:hypothetical protein
MRLITPIGVSLLPPTPPPRCDRRHSCALYEWACLLSVGMSRRNAKHLLALDFDGVYFSSRTINAHGFAEQETNRTKYYIRSDLQKST